MYPESGHIAESHHLCPSAHEHEVCHRKNMKQCTNGTRGAKVRRNMCALHAPTVHCAHMGCVRRDRCATFLHTMRDYSTLCSTKFERVAHICHLLHTWHCSRIVKHQVEIQFRHELLGMAHTAKTLVPLLHTGNAQNTRVHISRSAWQERTHYATELYSKFIRVYSIVYTACHSIKCR